MKVETKRQISKPNARVARQLVSDAVSECYEGCSVRIRALNKSGGEYELVGPVDRVDLAEERIYVQEAQAVEGVSLGRVISYEWIK
jgi:hypothetical protein